MKPFRFRAHAALDVRKRIEEDARKALSIAEEAARQADAHAVGATRAKCIAQDTLASAQQSGMSGGEIGWHRSWITRQRLEVDARRRDAAASAATVERAAASVRTAHQQRRTLERLRDRMAARHRLAAARHEQRDIDELAGLRFSARTSGPVKK